MLLPSPCCGCRHCCTCRCHRVPPTSPAPRWQAAALRIALGAQVRPRTGRAHRRSQGTGPKGRITQDDVAAFPTGDGGAVRDQRPGGQGARGGGSAAPASAWTCCPGPRWTSPSSARWSARTSRASKDQRRQPAPPTGCHPARHQPRRRRHHRPGSLPRFSSTKGTKERRQGHHAGLHHQAAVAALKKFPSSTALDGDQLVMKNYFTSALRRHAQRPRWCPSSATPTRRASSRSRKRWATWPKARDGKLGPADMTGGCFSSARWAALVAVTSRPSSTLPKSPSWACAEQHRTQVGRQGSSPAPHAALS